MLSHGCEGYSDEHLANLKLQYSTLSHGSEGITIMDWMRSEVQYSTFLYGCEECKKY